MKSYKCDNCGAELVINNDSNYTECIYCGSSIVTIKKEYEELNVKKMLPFSLTHQDVFEQLQCLNLIRSDSDILSIKGIFVPAYHYSSEFDYLINSNVNVYMTNKKIVHYSVQDLIFGTVNDKLISPFKERSVDVVGWGLFYTSDFVDFDPAIVGNYSLEYCEVDHLIEAAKEEIVNRCKSLALSQYIRERLNYKNSNSENLIVSDLKFDDYTTLLPIYIVKIRNGKTVFVNGNKTNIEKIKNRRGMNLIIDLCLIAIVVNYFIMLNEFDKRASDIFLPILFILFMVLMVAKLFKSNYRFLDTVSDNQKFSLNRKRLGKEKDLK